MNAKAHIITGIGRATATLLTRTAATAAMTEATGLRRYLRVTPQEPQTLLWLVPQVGIDYQVESNAKWRVI